MSHNAKHTYRNLTKQFFFSDQGATYLVPVNLLSNKYPNFGLNQLGWLTGDIMLKYSGGVVSRGSCKNYEVMN